MEMVDECKQTDILGWIVSIYKFYHVDLGLRPFHYHILYHVSVKTMTVEEIKYTIQSLLQLLVILNTFYILYQNYKTTCHSHTLCHTSTS